MVARKRSGLSVPVIVVALLLVIGAFSGEPSASSARDQAAAPATEQVQAAPASPESPDPQTPAASTPSEAPAASETPASPGTPDAPAQQAQAFDYAQVPPYAGGPYAAKMPSARRRSPTPRSTRSAAAVPRSPS